ncbi:hypothetical protein N7466_002032 [Penicillium verhagenii]|uniref:uncharacterized protein n=1 Tax=Penicillium verhagenii TaxID=1562060 RepID=UPI0025458BCC|nr:uncharacterized protein N7466_002032 [Penicillium verhagenii]KAJ5938898.1 hypothetical protein N7466_002032 [Penicillium verhagenii]
MPPKAGTRRTAAKAEDTDSTQNAPTPSAAPGAPGRPPVQRLQSLKKRAPGGGSITPATRSPSVLGGEPVPKPMKFRPKAVQRRSKEEREAMEKIEQERYNDRLKDAAAIQRGKGNRGGRGSFRGRGGAVGGGFRGRGGGPARGRARYGFTGSRDREDDSSDDELRMSIDQINLESDEDDEMAEDGKGKMPVRGRREKGLRPVRVTRHEHEDRVVAVNMESSSSKAAEIRQQAQEEAAEVVDDKPTPPEVSDEEPHVKDEPTDDADTPMEDLPLPSDDELLPRQRYRVRRKTSEPKSVEPRTEKTKEVVPPAPQRDPRELLRTKEELDEYDRHLDDLEHVRNLLSHQEPEPESESEPQTVPETTPGEDTATADAEPPAEKLANQHLLGHLFLMQFPPMTPNLSIPGSTEAPSQETIRPEPQAQPQPQVKSENEGEDVQIMGDTEAESNGTSKLITAATNWSLPAGRVGKLNVHKSGRVTMDWGGISFELDRAAAVDFVQEALIVSSPDPEEAGQPPKDDVRHQAWSMGQLSGKFTVMPNWDAML